MSKTHIPLPLRRRIIAASQGLCAYCHTSTAITGARPVLDHIVPEIAGGTTTWDNLCLACHSCNEFKGPLTHTSDPITLELGPIFHPRKQLWREHFGWEREGTRLVGLTPIGRATISALNMNHPDIVAARQRWVLVGWHPPQEDL